MLINIPSDVTFIGLDRVSASHSEGHSFEPSLELAGVLLHCPSPMLIITSITSTLQLKENVSMSG